MSQTIPAGWLTFGLMHSPEELIGMHQIIESTSHPIVLELNLEEGRQKIDIRFSVSPSGQLNKPRGYRLQANLQLVSGVVRYGDELRTCLVISVRDPPRYFQQTRDVEKTHTSRTKSWSEWPKMWERQTDIDNDMEARCNEPISLVRPDPIVDTGEDHEPCPGILQHSY